MHLAKGFGVSREPSSEMHLLVHDVRQVVVLLLSTEVAGNEDK